MTFLPTSRLLWEFVATATLCVCWLAMPVGAEEDLLHVEPFDRIVLDEANGSRQLDVLPLTFADRRLPSRFPRAGVLRVRLIEHATQEFEVRWANVAEILLYEQLLLNEALARIEKKDFDGAYDHIAALQRIGPNWTGLDEAVEQLLYQEMSHAFVEGKYERAWTLAGSLHSMRPDHDGLARAVDSIADRRMQALIRQKDFLAARNFMELIGQTFGDLGVEVARRWSDRLRELALGRLEVARQHLNNQQLVPARAAIRQAMAVVPELPEARELARQIHQAQPHVVVAVSTPAPETLGDNLDDWAARRVRPLLEPALIQLRGYTPEGGDYRSDFGEVLQETDAATTTFVLAGSEAGRAALDAHKIARLVLRQSTADPTAATAPLKQWLDGVSVEGARTVRLHWRQPHVRPESMLTPIALAGSALSLPVIRPVSRTTEEAPAAEHHADYQAGHRTDSEVLLSPNDKSTNRHAALPELVEETFTSDDEAVAALVSGSVDIVDRLSASHVGRLRDRPDIRVGQYALPTVHVLIPNPHHALTNSLELRRAMAYAIDRPRILNEVVVGNGDDKGHVVLSGPFPAGESVSDPIGYGYYRPLQPRAYEPRLAATLAAAAASLYWQAQGDKTQTDLPAITLSHPPDAVARSACQAMATQLNAASINVTLVEESPAEAARQTGRPQFRYAELAIWEPVVDAHRLLGPSGMLRRCTPRMALALGDLNQAATWQDVRTALHEVHQVAHQQLDVIPLWQTPRFFAYRTHIQGIARPVTLYQDVRQWRVGSKYAEADAP